MEANIIIPSPLRNFTNGERRIIMDSLDTPTTIKILVKKLDAKFPGIIDKILDSEGEMHNYVNIFLDSEDIRYIDGLNTEVSQGEEISIVPAVAGGNY
jgi:molybdopterin converting factor small subunit